MVKSVILIGGPYKKGNFSPFDMPAPLIPVSGLAMICHHLYALSRVPGLKDVFLYGYYDEVQLMNFISQRGTQSGLHVQYVEELRGLGTGGALAKEIDLLMKEGEDVIVIHSDLCSDFPLKEFYEWHRTRGHACSVMITRAPDQAEPQRFGYFIKHPDTQELLHHVEKPDKIQSEWINCGIYVLSPTFKKTILRASQIKHAKVQTQKERLPFIGQIQTSTDLDPNYLSLEKDVIGPSAGQGLTYLYELDLNEHFWRQIKTTHDILTANAAYLQHYQANPMFYNMFKDFIQLPNLVLIHTTASISPRAKLGPNVVIGAGCKVYDGVRIKNSIIQAGVEIRSFTYISDSIIGYNSTIGYWCRIEGNLEKGEETDPRVTVLGVGVQVENEVCIRNSIALPNKKIQRNHEGDHIV